MTNQKSFKKFVATATTATIVASALVPVALADEVKTAAFTDVAPQYKDAVDFVVEQAIAKGISETQFGISKEIIRGDAAIMIANAAKLNNPDAAASGFSDVPTRGALAINSLKAAGVTNGVSKTQFDFSGDITRGEAAIFLATAFKLKGDSNNVKFTDVNSRYMAAVAALVDHDVTNGKSATQFGTDLNITRGEFAKWIYALEKYIVDESSEASTAVTLAEESLLEADLEAAWELVNALEASDEKTLLKARLVALEELLQDLLSAINYPEGELDLYNALLDANIKNVEADYADDYFTELDEVFTSLADVQDAVDQVNVDIALDAMWAVDGEVTAPGFDLEDFYAEVAEAQAAIDAVPSDFPGSEKNSFLSDELQEELDAVVEYVEEYIELVSPVVNAANEVALYEFLLDNYKNTVELNVDDYDFAGLDTVKDVQYEIDFVNAEEALEEFGSVDAGTTQAEIDALTKLVKRISDQDAQEVKDLYTEIKGIQADFNAMVDANTKYAATVEKAETALDAYLAAGGSVEDDVYTTLEGSIEAKVAIADLLSDLEDIETATKELIAYDKAVDAAETALDAYIAAGGEETDSLYIDVEVALESELTSEIEDATDALNAETDNLNFVTAVNDATTATELQALLAELEVENYDNLPLVNRVEVAELLLEEVQTGDYDTYELVTTSLITELNYVIVEYRESIATVNNAVTIVEADQALEDLNLAGYEDLTAAEQLVVSEKVLNNKPKDGYTSYSSIIAQY